MYIYENTGVLSYKCVNGFRTNPILGLRMLSSYRIAMAGYKALCGLPADSRSCRDACMCVCVWERGSAVVV